MEILAGATAGAGLAAKETYMYNRENFMYDRNMRKRKEFKIQEFRVEQAELWRKDVRDLISLTEYKMHVYLLVNVLLLGFTVVLWCQGKLAHTTPVWLMTGYVLSIAGSFVFILLSVWLAMHAAVAAQGYETRLLTQLVRLPIPTWQEIEAVRTYASEFERLDAAQMFRVPFATGRQENLVPVPEDQSAEDQAPAMDSGASDSLQNAPPSRFGAKAHAHVDPWGLEGSGADIPELGCRQGHSMQHMRHVKLARQAMVYWQSYDAFARISMSIGVNQLLLAASYFILGYYLAEVKVASSATYGVVLLTAMAQTLNRLDMSLPWWQFRMVQLLLALGPACATLAGWLYLTESYSQASELLAVAGYLSHGLYLTAINWFCQVRQELNGAHLPVAFRSILYLDVFGWAAHSSSVEPGTPAYSRQTNTDMGASPRSPGNPWDADDPAVKPALGNILYDQKGRPLPRRPEDAMPSNAAENYSSYAGAAEPGSSRDPRTGQHVDFFQASSWLAGGGNENGISDDAIITGHEHEAPLILPWKTFSLTMNLLCISWLFAAGYHALDAAHFWGSSVATYHPASLVQSEGILLNKGPSVLSFVDSHVASEAFAAKELLDVTWPHANVVPHSIACDSAGMRFVASDGLTLFTAELNVTDQNMHDVSKPSSLVAMFTEVDCPPVAGEGLQDVAVTCPAGAASCEALILHKHGRRMAACPVGQSKTAAAMGGYQADLSDAWLEELRVGQKPQGNEVQQPHARIEKAVAISADSGCSGKGGSAWAGCVLLGTTRGRVVRLASRPGRTGMLSPVQALLDREVGSSNVAWKPGSMRSVDDRHFGVLSSNGTALFIKDKDGGHAAGTLTLDASTTTGFCTGGGHMYFLDQGPSPQIWRIPLPRSLNPKSEI
eukprot:TRINITY_DN21277_c0_g1_i1.p1 TRINITY_DN21277_c0_g1~~TRINITY_DN21277_c0_g1_i1.p1  ORF type:complete len:893 (-),score=161.34 TRINITY_DN21277_c0_g1_i1:135-2813(-)